MSSTATAEDKIAKARAWIEIARETGPMLVDEGRIHQYELDTSIGFLEVGLDLYVAALSRNDVQGRADARAEVLQGTVRLIVLLAKDRRDDDNA